MNRREFTGPTNPVGLVVKAARGAIRQLSPIRPEARKRPQAALAYQDATWWQLANVDSALVSGAVTVETVFGRPGIGQVIVQAATTRDIPVVSGVVLVVAATYIITNLLVDLVYIRIDPRITTT